VISSNSLANTTGGSLSASRSSTDQLAFPLSTADDQQLIQQCLSGNTEAFGDLVIRYQDRLYNSLMLMVGSPEDARDLAQEAFVHAFRKLDSFRGDAAFYTWLFRIAVNAAISFRRRAARQKSASIDVLKEAAGAEPLDRHDDSSPSSQIETQETQQVVRRALGELSEEFRTALVLTEIEGMSYEEAATAVGCPIGTIRSRIHRARNELREKLRLQIKEPPS
jgi:RNA polymerase sigma-70 factor (ECF subfamily)